MKPWLAMVTRWRPGDGTHLDLRSGLVAGQQREESVLDHGVGEVQFGCGARVDDLLHRVPPQQPDDFHGSVKNQEMLSCYR